MEARLSPKTDSYFGNHQTLQQEQVLISWKEVAAYFGKGVRTVQRWERKFGLPITRPGGKGIVVARPQELEAWINRNSVRTAQRTPVNDNGSSRAHFGISQALQQERMLTSWKEIAAYFGKGVRTVQRWERKFSLPVTRPTGKGIVVARPQELEAWINRDSVRTAVNDSGAPVMSFALENLQTARALAEKLSRSQRMN